MWFRPFEGLTIKAALVLSFGATVVLWVVFGLQLAERMRTAQSEASELNVRYMHAQDLLSSVRAQVLLSSVLVRDALLDPDPASLPIYRHKLDRAYRAADEKLSRYVPVVESSTERRQVAGLRERVAEFRAVSVNVLSSEHPRESSETLLLLSRDIGPRRDLAVRVSDEIQSINRSAFIQQQIDTAALYSTTQRRVWQRLGLALVASLCIAVIATMYVGRLERDVTRRRDRERQTTEELQRLSARLVVAQEEERRTIARELHDEVGQVLMAIKMELTLAQRAIEGQGGSGGLLDEAQAIADGALHTVRDLSHLLHPSLLDDLGLTAAVEWYLNGFGKRHAIRVALTSDGMEERLAPEMESTSFRIVQEALANIARHANATRCAVTLRCDDATLTLVVEDDGVGFDLESRMSHRHDLGLGLVGIRERASALGGRTRVDTAPGRGTRLIVEMPRRSRPPMEEVDETTDLKTLPSLEMTRG